MADLRLYIWENDGISDAYHDDGTLVVLAQSEDAARIVARASAMQQPMLEKWYDRGDVWRDARDNKDVMGAIEREPDRIVELRTPCVVAFNGGGYD